MAAHGVSDEVARLAAQGRKIDAIKLYRRESGAGLAEAKAAVDALPRSPAAPIGSAAPSPALASPTGDPRSTAASRRGAAILAATILGLFGAGLTGHGIHRSGVAAGWPEAEGEIVAARLVPGSANGSERWEVEYVFDVQGREVRGSRIAYAGIRGPGSSEDARSRYPIGAAVRPHYDPDDPARSVLETRVPPVYWLVFAVSLIAAAWGITRWIESARAERATAWPQRSTPPSG